MQKKESLAKSIYLLLRKEIISCNIEPGEIIQESMLIEKYNVSKTPIREALNRLKQEKLVTSIPYRGYMVTPLSYKHIKDTLELREIIEVAACRIVTERNDKEDILEIEQETKQLLLLKDYNYLDYMEWNKKFHLDMAKATKNEKIYSTLSGIFDEIYRYLFKGIRAEKIGPRINIHLDILNAVKSGNVQLAMDLTREHLRDSGKSLLELF
ncbi:MAG: GntR family transcriptional regulator [Bacillota bacterium]|jgi:DNA-binding GntR family transcriptional regulator